MIKKLTIFFCFFSFSASAQERLTELLSSPPPGVAFSNSSKTGSRSGCGILSLPFLDDFSGSRVSPDSCLWEDRTVFINSSYPVNPPSIGVATFDGLNERGNPYAPNQDQLVGLADSLTSRPIDLGGLTAADSVYLSFYYQPQGIGNDPQPQDSLVLEFWNSLDSAWIWQWSDTGSTLRDFKYVAFHVGDSFYLTSGFKFRFKNYANLAGSFDHWHLDYVYLDKNRTVAEQPSDVAFAYYSNSMLKNYTAIPWNQYLANPAAETKDSMTVRLRSNNYAGTVNYSLSIYHGNNIISNAVSGSHFQSGSGNFTFTNEGILPGGVFPSSESSTDSFLVVNVINPVPADINALNDTIMQWEKFLHHYAYDDGSAEAGYGLAEVGAQLAYKFSLNIPDTLNAVAMHFTNANADVSQKAFRITVWNDNNGRPGEVIYRKDSVSYPTYTGGVNGYHIYRLYDAPVLSGTIYIGWVQINDDVLNIGFDKNTDASKNMFFNTSGTWLQTQFKGSWMIRPVLGPADYNVNVKEAVLVETLEEIILYPNPATDRLMINGISEWAGKTIVIYDIYGRIIEQPEPSAVIDISRLPNAVYVLRITDGGGAGISKKFVVSR